MTFEGSVEKTRYWEINDNHALRIHTEIGEMIALDYQPFSIVDDVGFNHLLQVLEQRYKTPSRKYFTETILPNIYERLRQKVEIKIKEAKVLSSLVICGALRLALTHL